MTILYPSGSTLRPALRGVIFDLGGTLIYPVDGIEEANISHLLAWAAARGFQVPADAARVLRETREWMGRETYASRRQHTAREAIAQWARGLGLSLDDASMDEAIAAFNEPEVAAVQTFPGTLDALAALKALGLRLGLISNASDHVLIEALVKRAGLAGFLDPVVSSAAFGRIKPDPGIFRLVLDRWGYPAEACAMVGDTLEADISGAQALGMRAIHVTMVPNPWNSRYLASVHPDATASSPGDVVAIIKAWMAEAAV
jgi:putative hydrolase of the HAD superfamily